MEPYLHLPTQSKRPRHTGFGATIFSPSAERRDVETDGQLFDALKSGGNIHSHGIITVGETVTFPGNTKVTGGMIRAADTFSGNHLVQFRSGNRNLWLDGVELDASGNDLITFPITEEARNIILVNVKCHDGKTGISISSGASNILAVGVHSYNHSTWHGIAVQHTDCENIAILSGHFYNNGAYGIDSHGTHVEVAGNICEGNGQYGNYDGTCSKYPEAADHWIHDNVFKNNGDGYGCVWTYGDPNKGQRRPSDVFVYRNVMIGGPHLRSGTGATLLHCDNEYYDLDGNPAGMDKAGSGKVMEEEELRKLPTTVDDKTGGGDPPPPIDPPPTPEIITRQDIEEIAFAVAREEIRKVFTKMLGELE